MRACGVTRLIDAPAFQMNLVCGDSLLHVPLKSGGSKFTKGQREFDAMVADTEGEVDHAYLSEDLPELKRILRPNQYHAVVANPPYIVPKDQALNEQYRNRFESCHMKYSLAVPFMEQLFRLALRGANGQSKSGGFVGQITANSFMKREFGSKLIESFLPTVDLTHVVDTSGAYIPGHGTPTVIMFGKNQDRLQCTIRTLMGIQGEPTTPEVPADGFVWSAILKQIDRPDSESQYLSSHDSNRELFEKHPWSIGGGGIAELKELIEARQTCQLKDLVESSGFMAITGEDDVFVYPFHVAKRNRLPSRPFVVGDMLRDWKLETGDRVLFPYAEASGFPSLNSAQFPTGSRYLWSTRIIIRRRSMFGKTVEEHGFRWFEYMQFIRERVAALYLIAFAEVATHNNFVLTRRENIFKQTAPVVQLLTGSTVEQHYYVAAVLNCSTIAFWLMQVCFRKGGSKSPDGARLKTELWTNQMQFNSTNILEVPFAHRLHDKMQRLGREIDARSQQLCNVMHSVKTMPCRDVVESESSRYALALNEMIRLQEDIDWESYRLYGLIDEDLTYSSDTFPIQLGERAFEIILARKMAAGETQTTWFERHGSTPITELPAEWPDDYRQLVERRIALIASDPNIRLIEQPEYKRRWNTEPWDSQLERALREWLLDRLESYFDFDGRMANRGEASGVGDQGESQEGVSENRKLKTENPAALASIQLYSIAKLAYVASKDADFMQVAELYRDDPAFNVLALVEELVNAETVPLLPILRYKDTGLRKRAEWEKTWELQRREDAASDQLAVVSRQLEQATVPEERHRLQAEHENLKTENSKLTASIAVPPKYDSKDFLNANFWRLRGKLDVPKERWISFPGAEAEDGSLMICWAGYDHLQQAQAISAWYVEIRDQQGGHNDKRLIPLLSCLLELLPWIKQWHNSSDNEFNMSMADFFEGFLQEEARQLPRPAAEPTEPDDAGLFPDAASAVTYGWSLPEIQAWKPSAKRAAKRASKKAAKKPAAPKKATKKRGKKVEEG